MRIAQVAPLTESVPPKLHGGTGRIVAYLSDALVDLGHDVTLFASGDSKTKADLVSVVPEAIRLSSHLKDPLLYHTLQLQELIERVDDFDLIHFHTDYLHFPLSRLIDKPHVTTLHGRLDLSDLQPLYRKFSDVPVISVSYAQRDPLPYINWVGNVYHGIPQNLLRPTYESGKYLAFLGRISPEKRVDLAIEIAAKAGMKIKIAAMVDSIDQEYFRTQIAPLLKQPHVEFLGEIGDHQKSEFLGQAAALLFPMDRPEPFGLVMIEAMACGTPVIAFGHGSVPEVIDPGVTGFIVSSVEAAVGKVKSLSLLSRERVRNVFVERFSAQRMAIDYFQLYTAQRMPIIEDVIDFSSHDFIPHFPEVLVS